MDGKLHNEIIRYSKSKEPQESCGFVVLVSGEKVFMPCENVAKDKENHFEITPEDFINASEKGEIVALVHSHPQGEPRLSQSDLQTQLYSQLDFWLVCDEQIHIFPKIPFLIGREFNHGETDCYTLFRDFYRLSGCDLPDFERPDYWWEDGLNLYLDNMEKCGFEQVSEPQVGDVILISVGANVPNHAAMLTNKWFFITHLNDYLSVICTMVTGLNTHTAFGDTENGQR